MQSSGYANSQSLVTNSEREMTPALRCARRCCVLYPATAHLISRPTLTGSRFKPGVSLANTLLVRFCGLFQTSWPCDSLIINVLPGSNSVKGGYCTIRPAKLLICWILLKPLLRSFVATQSQTLRRECTGRQTEEEGQFSQRLRASDLWRLDCGRRHLRRGFLR